MSSRSFRRRTSRRRHRSAAAGDSSAQRPQGEKREGAEPPQGRQGGKPGGGDKGPRKDQGGGRSASQRPPVERPPRREPPVTYPDCPLCGKPVRELASALTHRASRQPAHFDCIVKELRDSTEVGPEERLCYLGGGCFGVLEFHPAGAASKFTIKKRIQYEEKEVPQDWKKPLQISC